jgi:phage gp36-like protein
MAYLIPNDYKVNIQDINVQQIINSDESIRDRAQLAAEAEAQSYLKQKYDIFREFQDLLPFELSKVYSAFNRFYLDADTYLPANSYNVDDFTLYQGKIYICNNPTTGTFTPADWDLLGKQYEIFFAPPPVPEFNYSNIYEIGDVVFFNNNIYTCRVQTSLIDHDTALQYRTIQNLPLPNVAPDDPINGVQYWGAPTLFSISGELPTNTNCYIKEDNRDAQMVLYTCDIVLYHLHARIAPRNIPELRVKRYDEAIAWLKMCAEGNVTPNSPLIKPIQGNRIRYGGNIRQINTY